MGDRTTVTLTVLASQAAAAQALFAGNMPDHEYEPDGAQSAEFSFSEVNYGNLYFLPSLVAAGIAYDSYWDSGPNFGAGTEHSRYTDTGEQIEMTIYEDERNPPLDKLLELIDKPEELKKYILIFKEAVTPLPLDAQQEANGKLYRARQLISPNTN